MNPKQIESYHRLATMLARHDEGQTVAMIAEYHRCSRAYIHQCLKRANSNADIKREAALIRQSSEQQMSFDFGA